MSMGVSETVYARVCIYNYVCIRMTCVQASVHKYQCVCVCVCVFTIHKPLHICEFVHIHA